MKRTLYLGALLSVLLSQGCVNAQQTQTLAEGTIINISLKTPLSTKTAKKGDLFKTQVIKAVRINGVEAVPLGATIYGTVALVKRPAHANDQAELGLDFNKLVIRDEYVIDASLDTIDNAKETIDQSRRVIKGLRTTETLAWQINAGIEALSEKYKTIADAAKAEVEKHRLEASGEIEFPAGMEFSIRLNKPVTVPVLTSNAYQPAEKLTYIDKMVSIINSLPRTATTQAEDKPADPINLVFLGSTESIKQAFGVAGWTEADKLDKDSVLRTTRAVIENRGYARAPVSRLYLFGRPEDLAFQKQGNTFAMRHHVRVWKVPAVAIDGRHVWVAAGTHDIGYEVTNTKAIVSHKIDPAIDKEREKIGDDLIAAGAVRAYQLIGRATPVTSGLTATGGPYHSDGNILILEIQKVAEK